MNNKLWLTFLVQSASWPTVPRWKRVIHALAVNVALLPAFGETQWSLTRRRMRYILTGALVLMWTAIAVAVFS